jgi:prepilin-type N-terminal cleavage/methylation domain-containing protein
MNKEKKIKNGFTLIEMIVSVAIITIGVLGVFSVITNYSQKTQQQEERLIATYLCQEGIEIVRNIRDTNWVNGDNWSDGLNSCTSALGGCEADFDYSDLDSYYDDHYLYIQNSSGAYLYPFYSTVDVKTPFRRKIIITPDGSDELDVQVDVYWMDHTMTIYENFYNWKP